MRLPRKFWKKDEFGCRGGVEFGFLSTSTKKTVAMQYSGGKALPTILQMDVGQVDRGATIVFLSQYPYEAEMLFPPLSNLEVVGKPEVQSWGGTFYTVVHMRINSNAKSLTLDEMIERRKTVHVGMLQNIINEAGRDMYSQEQEEATAQRRTRADASGSAAHSGWQGPGASDVQGVEGSEAEIEENSKVRSVVLAELDGVLEEHSQRPAHWFSDDVNFKEAIAEAVNIKGFAIKKRSEAVKARIGEPLRNMVVKTELKAFGQA
eukprot:CAMPEP_0173448318 /NCGR_PEP_ID=MMETSP1357-20121228/40518_1 /TAXON_ID=77926 /ORGANISM="Hemiselmis rufescens, Strain PCC563" /LENGTH=262 /DNA_ID=CAMNT_0014414817 /DNA_START=30 /DNA_END=814 /DNA_ORIENTATION=-